MIKVILYIVCLFVIVRTAFFIRGLSLINKHKCFGYFGVPGSGKTTKLTQLVYKVSKKRPVYVNWSVAKIPGHDIRYYEPNDFRFGLWYPEDGSAIFIDEISTIFDPRAFKTNFTPETRRWWAEHRHHAVAIFYGCQSWDGCDKVIRGLTDSLILCKRSMSVFVKTREIVKSIDIVNSQDSQGNGNAGGQIIDKFAYYPIPGFLYLPKWIRRFNSYEIHGTDQLKDIEWRSIKDSFLEICKGIAARSKRFIRRFPALAGLAARRSRKAR